MKFRISFIAFGLLLLCWGALQSGAWTHGAGEIPFSGGRTQGQSQSLNTGGDYPFINLVKTAVTWGQVGAGVPLATSMDANGYPTGVDNTGFGTLFNAPGQAERPGHQVITWLGAGGIGLQYQNFGSGGRTVISCVGTSSGDGACDNSTCTAFTGSITGKVLTVTVASSCSLVVGQPIAGFISTFDVPTFIIGNASTSSSLCSPACTGTGGTGTYAVNWSQTVASGSIAVGGRVEFTAGTEVNPYVQWKLFVGAAAGNTFKNITFMHVDDEATYWTGEIFGTLYKARIRQGGFAVWRNLDWTVANIANCTTWATRKPATYWSYFAQDIRPSLYGGTSTYALNGSSNDYSLTFGSGGPVDKQTIITTIPTTATNTTITFNLNGAGAKTVVWNNGNVIPNSSYSPQAADVITLIFDAQINGWLMFGGSGHYDALYGLNCGVPPEVFLQLNKEVGTHPWFVSPYLALDPMTDWIRSLATYVKANQSSWMIPRFEMTNETWNCVQPPSAYASIKSFIHWPSNHGYSCLGSGDGDLNEWLGMVGSTSGQDVFAVYGNKALYKVISGIQTGFGGVTTFNGVLSAAQFVANGPAQAGYVQAAASSWITSICVAPYWNGPFIGVQGEVAIAYNYSLAPSETIMATYLGTPFQGGDTTISQWVTWAAGFGITQTESYEGGYNIGDDPLLAADKTIPITGATNASSAVLTATGNGAVVGMTVSLSSLTGGTWSGAAGSYTVTAVGTNTITINLNSTGLGTLSGATLTYTGSQTYINAIRIASYTSTSLGVQTTGAYNGVLAQGGEFPSMYVLSFGAGTVSTHPINCTWCVWNPDIYGATNSSTDPGTAQWQAISAFN